MFLEIRTYRLNPGTGAEFVRVMQQDGVPLLLKFGISVVACGKSLVADNGTEDAYLIRAFGSLDERRAQEERFYRSDEWRSGPRDAIVSRIESYHTVVLDAGDGALASAVASLEGHLEEAPLSGEDR